MRIGIIGVGTHGSRCANPFVNDMSEFDLAAISRRSPDGKDQAVQWNCDWHQNWR